MNKKQLRNDLILIASLLAVVLTVFIVLICTRKKDHLVATVKVKNETVLTVNLDEKDEKDYVVKGVHGDVHIHVKDGAIAVVESNCPHQDCVNLGYIHTTGQPIICAYNQVTITIEGDASFDIEV